MADRESLMDVGDLTVYWCPICKVQTSRPWHPVGNAGLIPQSQEEHSCVAIKVEPIIWNLCCVCGVVAPDALWTYWQAKDDWEDEADKWRPSKHGEGDPMALCPACKWEHEDTDNGSGYYTGTLASMQAQRENDEAECEESWMYRLKEIAADA